MHRTVINKKFAAGLMQSRNDNMRNMAIEVSQSQHKHQPGSGLLAAFTDCVIETFSEENTMNFVVGEKYLVFMLTFFYVGKVKSATMGTVVFEPGAVWVSDTGRLGAALRNGTLQEGEIFPDEIELNISANGVCATKWRHAIPTADF